MKKTMLTNTYLSLVAVGLSIFLISCGGDTKNETSEAPPVEEKPVETCTYSYEKGSTELIWTAYKHTAKVGVKGVFDSVMVNAPESGNTVAEAISSAAFRITTASVNSEDSLRDYKIVEFFFKQMMESDRIMGEVSSAVQAEGSDNEGSGEVRLVLNGVEKQVPFTFTYEDPTVKLNIPLNLEDFNGQDAVASLNEKCAEKHTGKDGESKLWSEVDILVRAKLTKNCE